jgi:hypothetical protein
MTNGQLVAIPIAISFLFEYPDSNGRAPTRDLNDAHRLGGGPLDPRGIALKV